MGLPTALPPQRIQKSEPVPDDWDNEDDEEESEPQKLWDDANNKAPMPELVVSSSSTAASVAPPPAAFKPALRILKRPTLSTSASSSALSDSQQKSYAEREAQYQAARQRIFGADPSTKSAADSTSDSDRSRRASPSSSLVSLQTQRTTAATIIRNPVGPDQPMQDPSNPSQNKAGASRGFNRRKGMPTRTPG
ncbi:unnamed protein product [Somion occarium]|uniref:SUZ domain-containing protein n=1 Tax=Somion occarium TaxID=3059160 RepID=A0ABP1DNU1_9APHY